MKRVVCFFIIILLFRFFVELSLFEKKTTTLFVLDLDSHSSINYYFKHEYGNFQSQIYASKKTKN